MLGAVTERNLSRCMALCLLFELFLTETNSAIINIRKQKNGGPTDRLGNRANDLLDEDILQQLEQ